MDAEQIKGVLPHRYPFLLVDKVLEFEPGKRAVGVKQITNNENQFNGHFPERAVMPGVLQVPCRLIQMQLLLKPEGAAALGLRLDKILCL